MESVHNDRHNDRWVYNTNFHDIQLLDVENVQKLISMYRFTKPNVLFSDVVKKTSHTRTCDQMASKPKGKISQGTSVKWYGNQTLETGLKSDNTGVYTKPRLCLSGNQSRVNNSRSKQYCDSIVSICSHNRFEALPVEDCIVDKRDSSAVVDVKGDRQRHTSKTVNVKKQKRTVNKGKNVVHLFTEGAMPELLHEYGSNSTNTDYLNCHETTTTIDQMLSCTDFSKCPVEGTAGDIFNAGVLSGDKYSLEINTTCKSDRLRLARGATKNKNFLEQNKHFFGFIPIYGLRNRIQDENSNSVCTDILALHKLLRQDDRHNYEGLQVPVHSQLNFVKWKSYLQDYWDWQLPLLIKYGFPLDYNRCHNIQSEKINHKSAVQYPSHVDVYLTEEMNHGAMLGPFKEPPIEHLHTSPFMTRDKSSSDKRRVIIDLSWPKGQSVNSGVHSDRYLDVDFVLTYPSIDNITEEVLKLGKGCKIFKVDISRAFRHVPIDPGDLDLLGLHWKNYFIDRSLPFGFKHGFAIFQRMSDAVRFIMTSEGHKIWNYIDDFLCVSLPSKINHSYARLQSLLQELGLTVSSKKLVPPSTQVVCLGILVDTETLTISIPPEKLQSIKHMCSQWTVKNFCTKKELQSLLGSLLYVTKCIKYSRFFLNRMLSLLRENYDNNRIILTESFKRDLQWFNTFLPVYNGVTYFQYTPNRNVYLDACTTGLGAIYETQVYALPLPDAWQNVNIATLEMLNILVALKVWHSQWAGHRVLIHCDNQAVVSVLNTGKARDEFLCKIARNIFMWLSACNIDLQVVHVAGRCNTIADLLSRWFITSNNFQKLQQLIDPVTWIVVNEELLYTDDSI